MTDRLAAAQAALNAGRRNEAIEHLTAAVNEDPARNAQVYRTLVVQLYQAGRFPEGEAMAARALERYPRDYDLLNTRGVLLRKLRRPAEAAKVYEVAIKLSPKAMPAQQNLVNVLLELKDSVRAEQLLTKLVRLEPRNAEFLRQLGRALSQQGRHEAALSRLRQSLAINSRHVDSWLDLIGLLNDENRIPEADEALQKALATNPGHPRLLEGRVTLLRRSGQTAAAQQWLEELLPAHEGEAWIHYQLGAILTDADKARADHHLRRAVELEPDNLIYAGLLVENLERTRTGDEGGNIEEAYQLGKRLMPRRAEFSDVTIKVLTEVFLRTCDYDALDALGDFKTVGRAWASSGRHSALLKQLARVRDYETRVELVEQHRIWGRLVEEGAKRRPLRRPPPRPRGGKIRLGFLSSDLRQHPVGYFALPLFDHVDRERFEVFVYSFYQGKEDGAQRYIADQITAYRWWPDINLIDAAEKIAEDQLDILIELGGSTHMNKLEIMAYRAAPLQASWLGYPASAGLEAIDYFICDSYSLPTRPEYLIETPLVMPRSWIALGKAFFSDRNEIVPEPASERKGHVTFGTANNPHKYTRDVFEAWAGVLAAVPGSHFAFIRPEASGPTFQKNVRDLFSRFGVDPDRIDFHAIRGAHMPFYNELDISLDTFPLTGGTTTAESLWMGVPLISLKGEMFHERLSYSIMTNSGLGDLCVDTLDDYRARAVQLAADVERRRALRIGIRDQLRASPLGQTEQFAKEFYDMIHHEVTTRLGE